MMMMTLSKSTARSGPSPNRETESTHLQRRHNGKLALDN